MYSHSVSKRCDNIVYEQGVCKPYLVHESCTQQLCLCQLSACLVVADSTVDGEMGVGGGGVIGG